MEDGGGGGGGGGGSGVEVVLVVVVVDVVHVCELGLMGGGGGGGVGGCGDGSVGGKWWVVGWWRVVSTVANWSKAEPVVLKDLKYIICEAEKECLALTNCFMYLFLALHLDTISSFSNLE